MTDAGQKPARGPTPRRYSYSPELMAHGRHRYENTEDSLAAIAVEFGIHKSTLQKLAKREGWMRFKAPVRDVSAATRLAERAAALEEAALASTVAMSEAPPTPDPSPPLAALAGGGEKSAPLSGEGEQAAAGGEPAATPAHVALSAEIQAEIKALLADACREREVYEAMRARMKHLPQSPMEAERSTRTLSELTATVHRLQRLVAGQIEITPEDRDHDCDNDDIPTDIDALRDALARRIRAFFDSRRGTEAAAAASDEGSARPDQ